jgi:hypothetical protein
MEEIMQTATEIALSDIERGRKLYRSELRAKRIVDMCVANAMNESGEPDEYNFRRYAHDVATDATLTLLEYIYTNDGELALVRAEAAEWKRMAEQALAATPRPIPIICDSGRLPKGENAEGG